MSSQLADPGGDHPEHRIYRKSAIRFSLLQRFRAIISEEQRRGGKLPAHRQGSRSMGEKIANQDYADPARLFTRDPSTAELEEEDFDLMGEREKLDMTIDERDVLREIEQRLELVDTGQARRLKSSQSCNCSFEDGGEGGVSSSQSAECFYETIMEKELDEGVDGPTKRRVESFSDTDCKPKGKVAVKRPNKAPPPVPAKPKGLANISNNSNNKFIATISSSVTVKETNDGITKASSKSWVKTMVGRFE